MIHHPQGQTRCDRIAPVQVDRLKAGVGDRACRIQGLATAHADRRVMRLLLMRLEHLGAAHPRSAGLFAGFTGRLDLRRLDLRRLDLRHFR